MPIKVACCANPAANHTIFLDASFRSSSSLPFHWHRAPGRCHYSPSWCRSWDLVGSPHRHGASAGCVPDAATDLWISDTIAVTSPRESMLHLFAMVNTPRKSRALIPSPRLPPSLLPTLAVASPQLIFPCLFLLPLSRPSFLAGTDLESSFASFLTLNSSLAAACMHPS